MTYELAKELKDAGFPQNMPQMDGWPCKPTLSELIEECGKAMYGMYRADVLWHATGGKDVDDDRFMITFEEDGSTPEEAVARLWLALNKKEV